MYDRLAIRQLPFPFSTLPPEDQPVDTLDFLPAMDTLLHNMQGLAATAHAGSLSDELAYQELTQALFILKEYTEATLVLFERWHRTRYPGPTVDDEEAGNPRAWRPQDAG